MGTIASLNVVLAAQTAPFQKGLQSAQGTLSGFGRGISGIGSVISTGLSAALGPIGLVIGGIAGIATAMSGATEAAQASKKLDAVLAATGGAAGLSANELKGFAGDLQNVTNFEDDATVSAMAVLASFKEIKGDVFKDATVAAMDMSAVLGTDLQGSITQIGKSLNDPIKGVNALRRAGVSFTAEQLTQIKTMQQAGDIAGAQAIVLAELKGEFGGAAAAMADPFTIFRNKVGDVMESVGAIFIELRNTAVAIAIPIVDALGSAFGAIVDVVGPVLGALTTRIESGIAMIASVVGPIWQGFTSFIGNAFSAVLDWLAPLIVSWSSAASAGFTMLAEIGMAAWDALSTAIGVAGDYIGMALNAVGINMQSVGGWGTWLRDMLQAAYLVMEFGFTHWKDIASLALLSVGYGIVSFANQTIHFFTVALPGYLSWFGTHWKEVFTDIVNLTATVATNIWQNLSNLWDGIVGLFSGNGFSFTWTPLTEGFKSAITELPKIAARELGPLEKELGDQVSALAGKVNEDFGAFANKRTQEIATETQDFRAKVDQGLGAFLPEEQTAAANLAAPTAPALSGGGGEESKVGALVRGSAEAFKAANGNGLANLTQVAEKQLAQSERQTRAGRHGGRGRRGHRYLSAVVTGVDRGSRSGEINKDRVRKYSVTFRVETDNKEDGPQVVLNAFGLPSLYSYYAIGNDVDAAALCVSGKASEFGEGGKSWKVVCEFASDAIPKSENPLDDPVRYSLQWAQHTRVVEQDQDGNPLTNTVGDLFTDPPYTQDDSRPVLVATKNYSAADFPSLVSLAVDYKDSVNADSFYGASAGQVKLTNITTGDLQTQNEIDFYKVTFEFSFNPDGWQPEILNRGHRAKDEDGNTFDLPSKEVRNLKEDGTLVEEGDDPYFIPFTTFPSRPFLALGV